MEVAGPHGTPLGLAQRTPQLEKNHVVPTSWQDEALARHGVSREFPCSALILESHNALLLAAAAALGPAPGALGLGRQRLWFFQWSCMDVRVGLGRKLSAEEWMLLNCGVGEDT